MKNCPHCGMSLIEPSVDHVVALLNGKANRSIYEIGDLNGKGTDTYTIDYGGEMKMPTFSRTTAEAVAATGIVREEPTCRGYFHRVS